MKGGDEENELKSNAMHDEFPPEICDRSATNQTILDRMDVRKGLVEGE